MYRVKHTALDLDSVLSEMGAAYKWIVGKIQFSDPDFASLKWGETLGFAAHFRINETVSPESGVGIDPAEQILTSETKAAPRRDA